MVNIEDKKPWDRLRKTPKKLPIASGKFYTENRVPVLVDLEVHNTASVHIERGYVFKSEDLRQIADFCQELADQLEE